MVSPRDMPTYAHTKFRPDGTTAPQSEWEPLFTRFGHYQFVWQLQFSQPNTKSIITTP